MGKTNERGFSLIELLMVVAIIGIVAALSVPSLQKATRAAENGSTFSMLHSLTTTQVNYSTQNGRYARITELNSIQGECWVRFRVTTSFVANS